MGLIWNLLSLAKNAKQVTGSFQQVRGQAAQAQRALTSAQDHLVQKDYERALAGDSKAQFEMGERFYQGLGVPRDYAQALAWFQVPAHHGHTRAQYMLGIMFFLGRGVAADAAEAYKWLILAAQQGDEEARATKQKIAAKIHPDARAEGVRRATELAGQPVGP
jgi:TPR repeat protein